MAEGKTKFIEDAAKVIDGRVAALKQELELDKERGTVFEGDRSAILEAEFCARLIRQLMRGPYRGEPYAIASDRWSKHGDL